MTLLPCHSFSRGKWRLHLFQSESLAPLSHWPEIVGSLSLSCYLPSSVGELLDLSCRAWYSTLFLAQSFSCGASSMSFSWSYCNTGCPLQHSASHPWLHCGATRSLGTLPMIMEIHGTWSYLLTLPKPSSSTGRFTTHCLARSASSNQPGITLLRVNLCIRTFSIGLAGRSEILSTLTKRTTTLPLSLSIKRTRSTQLTGLTIRMTTMSLSGLCDHNSQWR